MPKPSASNNEPAIKAGALLCPVCCVELIEIAVDFDVDNAILRGVKILRCPICQEEQFSPGQQTEIEQALKIKK